MDLKSGRHEIEVALGRQRLSLLYAMPPATTAIVLFVHGLGVSRDCWDRVFDRPYFPHATLLLPDLVGFGRSPKPEDFSYTMPDQAAACEQLLSLLPPLDLYVAAHSMGNAVALLFSPATMARVRAFANLEGNLIAADCGFSRLVANIPFAEYRDRVFPAQQAEWQGNAALRLDHTTATAVHRSSQSLVHWSDSGELLARFLGLSCRKSYFWGEENAAMPVLQQLGGVETQMIPRSGHGMMLDNPDAFYTHLARFFGM